ncbi:MAG: hypothetical protein IIC67_02745 [Thaumarchaeota archaeon]|nr:hypothetical protein [Nitrososphaerota archaeon]
MKKKIEIEFEPIIIYDETPRQIITQIFKKHKQLILPQLFKATNLNKNTILSELRKMIEDGVLVRENKTVLINPKHQARSMTVWTWIENGHK